MVRVPGYVDVWNNESGTCPVRTFRGPGATRAVRISRDGGSVLAAHGDLVRVETRERGREDAWGQHRLIQTPLHVSDLGGDDDDDDDLKYLFIDD